MAVGSMLRCPSCSSSMVSEDLAAIQIQRCPSCGGFWVSADDLHTLADQQAATKTRRFTPAGSGPLYTCPGCRTGTLRAGSVEPYKVMVCSYCGGPSCPRCHRLPAGHRLGPRSRITMVALAPSWWRSSRMSALRCWPSSRPEPPSNQGLLQSGPREASFSLAWRVRR